MFVIDGHLRGPERINDFLDQVVTLLPLFLCEDRDILGVKQLPRQVNNKRWTQSWKVP